MSRKPRGLRPEEEDLWKRVARTTTPLEKANVKPRLKASPKPAPKTIPTFDVPAFRIGEKADTAMPRPSTPQAPVRMDKKAFTRMKRGKTSPEARLDLHGMTADAAHTALTAFLLRSHDRGLRLVLVITGKGQRNGPLSESKGVLRRQLPHWVTLPPLNRIVMQTTEAHQRHGGSGAFYVYLNRRR